MKKTTLSIAFITASTLAIYSANAKESSFQDYLDANGDPGIPAELLPYMEDSQQQVSAVADTVTPATESVEVATANMATTATETAVKTATQAVEKAMPETVKPAVAQASGKLTDVALPTLNVSNASFIPSIFIPKNSSGENLDVTLLDGFIKEVSPNARHYPPNFPNKTQAYNTRQRVKQLVSWIDPYASAPDASYEVLIRAAQLNGIARNLDLGSDYAVRGSKYVSRALKLNSSDIEANVLYGLMLAEGGGFKEGRKYLDKAAALGSVEAEQSIAQSELMTDNRAGALSRLQSLQTNNPNNAQIGQQIAIVESGQYYIWDLPAPDINVKPVS